MRQFSVLFVLGLTAFSAGAEISDADLMDACMSDIVEHVNLPEGMSHELIRPNCQCVIDGAQTEAMRLNLAAYAAADLSARRYIVEPANRMLLWECFNVAEEHRVIPEGAMTD